MKDLQSYINTRLHKYQEFENISNEGWKCLTIILPTGWLKILLGYFLESEAHQVSYNGKKFYSIFIMKMTSLFILVVTSDCKY